ncbi:hypothetical protein HUG10_20680 (plasmid) [Halorarum halophilum]|uniref:Uncharacterized protein n=1 Tax=Halorarum halophilum TaxID=2743090 RepID=A0A7D5GPT6_9EURY|nr:hypothetical protein [Halobaculum halophilum]QLG30024.1 hypothetical protein HUG10_20680 [Halobaculum halophilum]
MFIPISPRGPLYGIKPEHGDSFIVGYALVRPKTQAESTYDDKAAMFEQFADKDEAYVWEKKQPTYIPPEKLTPRFIIEPYYSSHINPAKSGWAGMYYVEPTHSMLSGRDGFRIVAVAEVPPGTEFAYPFGSIQKLKDGLDDRDAEYTIDPRFERIA